MQLPNLSAFALALGCLALPLQAAPPAVATDLPPVHSLVATVMGDIGSPTLLLEHGANAHTYQMRPADAQSLQDAQLVFWMGPTMTPWLERALNGIAADAAAVALMTTDGTHLRHFDEEGGHAEEDHDDGHHDHGDVDPHAWLDPDNARYWLGVIAGALSDADPDNADRYAANAAAAEQRIAALDATLAAELAPIADRPFVVGHDAYGYFTDHYGLTAAGAVALGDATAPDARHLSELRDAMLQAKVVCIFPEAQQDPKQIAILADGTDLRTGAPLDPSGSTLDPGPALYETLMRNLASNLRDCLAQD